MNLFLRVSSSAETCFLLECGQIKCHEMKWDHSWSSRILVFCSRTLRISNVTCALSPTVHVTFLKENTGKLTAQRCTHTRPASHHCGDFFMKIVSARGNSRLIGRNEFFTQEIGPLVVMNNVLSDSRLGNFQAHGSPSGARAEAQHEVCGIFIAAESETNTSNWFRQHTIECPRGWL